MGMKCASAGMETGLCRRDRLTDGHRQAGVVGFGAACAIRGRHDQWQRRGSEDGGHGQKTALKA